MFIKESEYIRVEWKTGYLAYSSRCPTDRVQWPQACMLHTLIFQHKF